MNFSPKSTASRPDAASEALVGRDVHSATLPARNDLSDWIELMEAVEALCPVWPQREPVRHAVFKL